jgi:hypothetical protein
LSIIKMRPRPHKDTLSLIKTLSRPEEQLLLTTFPKLVISPVMSSLIKLTKINKAYTHPH